MDFLLSFRFRRGAFRREALRSRDGLKPVPQGLPGHRRQAGHRLPALRLEIVRPEPGQQAPAAHRFTGDEPHSVPPFSAGRPRAGIFQRLQQLRGQQPFQRPAVADDHRQPAHAFQAVPRVQQHPEQNLPPAESQPCGKGPLPGGGLFPQQGENPDRPVGEDGGDRQRHGGDVVVHHAVADDQPRRGRQQPKGDHDPGKQEIRRKKEPHPAEKAAPPSGDAGDGRGQGQLERRQQPEGQLRQEDGQGGKPSRQRGQPPPPAPARPAGQRFRRQQQKPGDIQVQRHQNVGVNRDDPFLPPSVIFIIACLGRRKRSLCGRGA